MNVVMVSWRFHPHGGGVERHVMEVSRRLVARGHRITVVTEAYEVGLASEEVLSLPEGPLRILRIPPLAQGWRTYLRPAWWWRWGRATHAFREASVLQAHDFGPLLYWLMPVRWLFHSKPVFLTFHGWEGVFPPAPRVVRLRQWLARRVQGTLAIGAYIDRWYGTQCSRVSYGGVSLCDLAEGDAGGRGMVYLGRLAPDTGAGDCLETVAKLRDLGVDLSLRVCGEGSLRQDLEARARQLGLDAQFLGWVADPAPVVSDAAMVFCSGYLGILESMAQGRLVCATYDNPLKEDYLRKMPGAAWSLIVEGTPGDLARRLAALWADPERVASLVQEGRAWARSQTWDRVADDYEDLWRRG